MDKKPEPAKPTTTGFNPKPGFQKPESFKKPSYNLNRKSAFTRVRSFGGHR